MNLVLRLEQTDASSLVVDPRFKTEIEGAIADGLNEIKLDRVGGVQVDSLEVLPKADQSSQTDRFWIAFRVQGENETYVKYNLTEGQAVTKARFSSSFKKRMEDQQVSLEVVSISMAPARLAIQYLGEPTSIEVVKDEAGFFERLFQADQSDTVTVMLGGLSGILLGLIIFFCCLHYSKRWKSSRGPLLADEGGEEEYPSPTETGVRPGEYHYENQAGDYPDYGYDPNAAYDPQYNWDADYDQPYPDQYGPGYDQYGGGDYGGGDDGMPNWDAGDPYDGPLEDYDHTGQYPYQEQDYQDYGQYDGGYGQQGYGQQGAHYGQYGGAYGDEEEEYEY